MGKYRGYGQISFDKEPEREIEEIIRIANYRVLYLYLPVLVPAPIVPPTIFFGSPQRRKSVLRYRKNYFQSIFAIVWIFIKKEERKKEKKIERSLMHRKSIIMYQQWKNFIKINYEISFNVTSFSRRKNILEWMGRKSSKHRRTHRDDKEYAELIEYNAKKFTDIIEIYI